MAFEPDEPLDPIFLRVAIKGLGAMLMDALDEIGGDAGVEGAVRRPREDIDAGIAFHRRIERQGRPRVKPGVTMGRSDPAALRATRPATIVYAAFTSPGASPLPIFGSGDE